MRAIKTLIIDDELLARSRIRKLLQQVEEISLVAECKNGKEAIEQIKVHEPDLIFLDIQMPDFNGFEVIKSTKVQPFIIFVTAFDEYALKAFDVKATDYLLKPYDDDRFFEALDFAKKQIHIQDKIEVHQKMVGLLDEHHALQNTPHKPLILKDRIENISIRPDQIYWIEADGNYVKIYAVSKRYLYRSTLHEIFDKLPDALFMRIHRSILINTKMIDKVIYKSNNQFVFQLKSGDSVLSSRGFKSEIKEYLKFHPKIYKG
jgi:two-component system LytT family response regulator